MRKRALILLGVVLLLGAEAMFIRRESLRYEDIYRRIMAGENFSEEEIRTAGPLFGDYLVRKLDRKRSASPRTLRILLPAIAAAGTTRMEFLLRYLEYPDENVQIHAFTALHVLDYAGLPPVLRQRLEGRSSDKIRIGAMVVMAMYMEPEYDNYLMALSSRSDFQSEGLKGKAERILEMRARIADDFRSKGWVSGKPLPGRYSFLMRCWDLIEGRRTE